MAISEEFLRELRERIDIEDVVSPYVNLRRRGRLLIGLCPFHNEKTPSFTVYPDTQSFYCFGCGVGGEIVTFIRRIENLDFAEAVKTLAERAGMTMPEDGFDMTISKLRMDIFSANREAAKYYHSVLTGPQGKKAYDYLIKRGFTPETIRRFGLGFAPGTWTALIEHMRKKGYSQQLLQQANLAVKSSGRSGFRDNFVNRLMIPIIDLRGNVIAFGGRVLDDTKPKYINTSDTLVYKKSSGVFGLNFAKRSGKDNLIIVEGYLDVMALHQAGFTNAIACLGTALTKEQAQLISRYTQEAVLVYDADEAGRAATEKALKIFAATGVKVRVMCLSEGKDPDEAIRKFGAERFRMLLEGASNEIEFKLQREREKFDLKTDDGKLGFLKAAALVLAQLRSPLELDIYASSLAREIGADKSAILSQVKYNQKRLGRERETRRFKDAQREMQGYTDKINTQKAANTRAAKAEETILSLLLNNPEFYKKVKTRLKPETFLTDFNRRIFITISQRLEEGRGTDLTLLAGEFNEEEMSRLSALVANGSNLANSISECEDCIRVLLEEGEKRERRNTDVTEMSDEEFLDLFRKKNID